MQFTKIKATGKVVDIEWNTPAKKRPDTSIEHALKTKEPPHPDFLAALQAFKPEVLKLLELPKNYGEAMTVTGLTLTHAKDRLGVVVTSQRKLDGCNSPFNLHTPHLQEAGDDDSAGVWLSDGMLDLIRAVETHALAYIDGVRAQVELALAGAEK